MSDIFQRPEGQADDYRPISGEPVVPALPPFGSLPPGVIPAGTESADQAAVATVPMVGPSLGAGNSMWSGAASVSSDLIVGNPRASRRTGPPRIPILVATCLVLIGAVAGVLAASLGGSPSAQTVLLSAVNKTLSDNTAQVALQISASAAGTQISMTANGYIDFSKDALSLDASARADGQTQQTKLVYVGGSDYEMVPDLDQLFPGKTWVSVSASTISNMSATQQSESIEHIDNPASNLELLKHQGGKVESLGKSIVDGASVQGYSVSFGQSALQSLLEGSGIPRSKLHVAQILFTVYVDTQGQLKQETVSMHVSLDSHPVSMSVTIDLSDYGAPVDVSAPSPSVSVGYKQLNQKLAQIEQQQQSNSCEPSAPPGASAQALKYLNAANAGYQGWQQVTQMIQSNNGGTNLAVLELQSKTDTNFLRQLKAITFTGAAAAPAEQLENDMSSYLSYMAQAESSPSLGSNALWNAMDNVSDERADASSALRTALQLPQSSCNVMRP
ncbi:MAG: hypothetical protein WAM97_19735 [Acidimicrobiales bacterium]